jgi:hypothetical protein
MQRKAPKRNRIQIVAMLPNFVFEIRNPTGDIHSAAGSSASIHVWEKVT